MKFLHAVTWENALGSHGICPTLHDSLESARGEIESLKYWDSKSSDPSDVGVEYSVETFILREGE